MDIIYMHVLVIQSLVTRHTITMRFHCPKRSHGDFKFVLDCLNMIFSLKYIRTRVYTTLAHLYSLVGWLL